MAQKVQDLWCWGTCLACKHAQEQAPANLFDDEVWCPLHKRVMLFDSGCDQFEPLPEEEIEARAFPQMTNTVTNAWDGARSAEEVEE